MSQNNTAFEFIGIGLDHLFRTSLYLESFTKEDFAEGMKKGIATSSGENTDTLEVLQFIEVDDSEIVKEGGKVATVAIKWDQRYLIGIIYYAEHVSAVKH